MNWPWAGLGWARLATDGLSWTGLGCAVNVLAGLAMDLAGHGLLYVLFGCAWPGLVCGGRGMGLSGHGLGCL
jgi:hypothetical protein